jgi:hypothetical protein
VRGQSANPEERRRRCQSMTQNGREEDLLVRAEPLDWAEEIAHRMVDVVRVEDGALLLDADPKYAGAINAVLVAKGVWVKEIRNATTPERLIARSHALTTSEG